MSFPKARRSWYGMGQRLESSVRQRDIRHLKPKRLLPPLLTVTLLVLPTGDSGFLGLMGITRLSTSRTCFLDTNGMTVAKS